MRRREGLRRAMHGSRRRPGSTPSSAPTVDASVRRVAVKRDRLDALLADLEARDLTVTLLAFSKAEAKVRSPGPGAAPAVGGVTGGAPTVSNDLTVVFLLP